MPVSTRLQSHKAAEMLAESWFLTKRSEMNRCAGANSSSTPKLEGTAESEPRLWKPNPSRWDSIPSTSTMANLPEHHESTDSLRVKGTSVGRAEGLRCCSGTELGSHREQNWLKFKIFCNRKTFRIVFVPPMKNNDFRNVSHNRNSEILFWKN